jgi:tetratricopeptide (TPR) repeat protein
VEARVNREASSSLVSYASTMEAFLNSGENRAETLFTLQSRIAATESTVNTLRTGQTAYAERADAITALPADAVPERARERIAAVRQLWSSGINRGITEERALAVQISVTRTDGVDTRLDALRDRLSDTEPLVVGGEEEDADGIVRTVRYPDDALAEYLAVQQLVIDESETIQLAADELATENDYVLNGPAVRNEQSRLATLNERTDTLLATASEGVAVSRNLIAQSEALVNEANQRIADTRAAIAAFQVNPARNNYAAARDAFLEALALREDPALRENSDELIRAVGAELQELENVIVVRRVRELITAAEELYGQDEYVAARDTLLTAQETWEQTNVEPNTEVDRLLRLVTAALSLEEGRVLTATDPLYPVLGNYLSIAREDFNQGVRLYEAGSTDRANAFFDRSIENLRNVRDVRPLNWDARILELRIAQIRNEEDFDQVFAARFDQAVSRLDEAGPLEVYSELEVLAEINPDYPGIQEQIRRLEIALGLRENPVDQARINRAAELLRRARTLANGSRDEATVAISLLEEAVDLNPRNSDAKFLLDQLRIRLGGQATVALSSADEEQYRRAETLFVQGRALQALQITEQLLQNGANRSYPPLVELRRRIGLRLGI